MASMTLLRPRAPTLRLFAPGSACSLRSTARRPKARTAFSRLVAARAASTSVQTQELSSNEGLKLLNEQRNRRPSSPHFTIYQPQLTWLSSIANRVTGSGLSVGLYAFSLAYLLAPAVGMPFDGASFVSLVSSLPEWAKYSAKVIIGAPFWFHTFNGIRHLNWDMGFVLDLKKSYAAGYTVLAATALATVATAFLI